MTRPFPIPKPSTVQGTSLSTLSQSNLAAADELHSGNVDVSARVFDCPQGRMQIHGWVAGSLAEAHQLGLRLMQREAPTGEMLTFAGANCYAKASFLVGKTRWRHGLRQGLLRNRTPRVQEYFNLCWLHNRHFQVPLPLVGGAVHKRGLPVFQFLITRAIEESITLESALEGTSGQNRTALLEELASEVGRMHALAFVHHDLFARNVLVGPPDWPRRIVFIDTWAGGDCVHFRSPAYDLACWLLDTSHTLQPAERGQFLATYRKARIAQGKPQPRGEARKIAGHYFRLLQRLDQQPQRLRGAPRPLEWAQLGDMAL